MLLNKRQLEKLKEDWWKSDEYQSKCEKPEDQSDGISIQNIGGVFIVIFVGIGMACITLVVEYCYYRYRRNPQIADAFEASIRHNQRLQTIGKQTVRMIGAAKGDLDPPMEYKSKLDKEIERMKNNELRARATMPMSKPKFKFQI